MTSPSQKLTSETKVGLLVVASVILGIGFLKLLGLSNPFQRSVHFYVTYNFAGGIEIGSPVRVSGIKVGKVEAIEFFVPSSTQTVAKQEPGAETPSSKQAIVPLRLKVSVSKEAARGIREDSKFYINIAGIIGERYIEITPGSQDLAAIAPDATLPGIDPPRLDQLLSQSFDLAGKIKQIVDENKGDISKSIDLLFKLSGQVNETLKWVDKSALFKRDLSSLIDNLISITSDVKKLTAKTQSEDGKKTLDLLHKLLWRLEPLDSKQVREFLQKEGVKVQIF